MSAGRGSLDRTVDPQAERTYPALLLVSSVVFPHDVVSIQLPDEEAAAPLQNFAGDEDPVLATVLDGSGTGAGTDPGEPGSLAVLCRVVQTMSLPGGGSQVVLQGLERLRVTGSAVRAGAFRVTATRFEEPVEPEARTGRLVLEIFDLLSEYLPRDGTYPDDLESILRMNVHGPARFADLVAAYLHLPLPVKREVALRESPAARLECIADAIRDELARFSVETDIHRRVRDELEDRQREQYLRHQMRAIRRELGDEGSPDAECDELARRARKLPKDAREVAEREIRRLRAVSPSSAEFHVIRNYVGWLLDLPWKQRTRDRLDLARAREMLDRDHAGLNKVKERILEHLAVRKLKRNQQGSILCLVGPPGVGKTSLGRAVARALGRRFVRMSVGGLRDESEIKGHRRTYVGAMPGKVLQLMRRAGVKNPVLQIDEIDKMGADHRGDPSAALLEVLDPEVNPGFRDHYLDVGYDLSQVFFLLTANLLDPIPAALRDRLEILRIGGYTRTEKLAIARDHLVPRALERHGLRASQLRFTAGGLECIVDGYTREAGLRELERRIQAVCRKVATRVVAGDGRPVRVGKRDVAGLLGPAPYRPLLAGRRPEVGVATGLAWTAAGGALLSIEATRMPGKGKILVTGHLGEVMKESAQAALSYVRSHAREYGIDPALFRDSDVHIHFPEGATPKDGPSAGVAIATCLASLFTRRPVRHDLAMTGEITLKGRVLEVGGVKEKLLAAHGAGLRTVLIPEANLKDLEEVPDEVRRALEIVGTDEVESNICEALLEVSRPAAPRHAPETAQPVTRLADSPAPQSGS